VRVPFLCSSVGIGGGKLVRRSDFRSALGGVTRWRYLRIEILVRLYPPGVPLGVIGPAEVMAHDEERREAA
jgi:hypothetical protein